MRFLLVITLFISIGNILGQKKSKLPKLDSTQTLNYTAIHFSKGKQGLFDLRKNAYIIPLGNYRFIPIGADYISMADLTNKKVAILLINDFVNTQTPWDTKQYAYLDSGFGFLNPLHSNAYHSLRLSHIDITDNGKGCREKHAGFQDQGQLAFGISIDVRGTIYVFKTEEKQTLHPLGQLETYTTKNNKHTVKNLLLFHFGDYLVWKTYPDTNQEAENNDGISDNPSPFEIRLTNDIQSFQTPLYQCKCIDAQDGVDAILCQLETSCYTDALAARERVTSKKSLTDSTYYPQHIKLTDDIVLHYNVSGTYLLTGENQHSVGQFQKHSAIIESSEVTFYATHTDNHYFIQIRSINDYHLWRTGVIDIVSNRWIIEPHYRYIIEMDNHYYARKMSLENEDTEDYYEVLEHAIFVDAKGKILIDFGNRSHYFDEAFGILGIDSIQDAGIHQYTGVTYYYTFQKGQKGLIKFDTYYGWPQRLIAATFDELIINAPNANISDCFDRTDNDMNVAIGIVANQPSLLSFSPFSKPVVYSPSGLPYFYVSKTVHPNRHYDFETEFEIYYSQKTNTTNLPKPINIGNIEYGFSYHNNRIITQLKEDIQQKWVESYNEYGEPIVDDNGEIELMLSCYSGSSKTGVYDLGTKKWIIEPTKHGIQFCGGHYLVQEYDKNKNILSFIYDQTGNKMRQIFTSPYAIKEDLSSLFIAKQVVDIGNDYYNIETLNDMITVKKNREFPKLGILAFNNPLLLGTHSGHFLWYNSTENCFQFKSNDNEVLDIATNQWGLYAAEAYNKEEGSVTAFSEVDPLQMHHFVNAVQFGMATLTDKNKTIIISNQPNRIEYIYNLDEWGGGEIIEYYLPGKYYTGLFNHRTNRWDLPPIYNRIFPNVYGYTAIQTDDIDRNKIIHTYTFYNHALRPVATYTDTNQSIGYQPKYIPYLHHNMSVDSIFPYGNTRILDVLGQFKDLAKLQPQYVAHRNGHQSILHYDNGNVQQINDFVECVHYDPLREMPISVVGDSLIVKNLRFPIKNSTIQLYASENNHRIDHLVIKSGTSYGYFRHDYHENWIPCTIFDTIMNRQIEIKISSDEIHIIEDRAILDFYFFVTDDYYLEEANFLRGLHKLNDDVLWRKENGKWKEIIREERILPTPFGMNCIKSLYSTNWPKQFGLKTSVICDRALQSISFGDEYKNPIFLYSLTPQYHVIEFEKNSKKIYAVVDHNKNIITDSFVNYSFEDGQLFGMEYDEFGDYIIEPTPIELKK
jgi:hypothetical protein